MGLHALRRRVGEALNRRGHDTPAESPHSGANHADDPRNNYHLKLEEEIEYYRSVVDVHDLPDIFHYWSNKYLVPKFRQFGFGNPKEFFASYMIKVLADKMAGPSHFISVGSGNCEFEIEIAE